MVAENCRKGAFKATFHWLLAITAISFRARTKREKMSTGVPGDGRLCRG